MFFGTLILLATTIGALVAYFIARPAPLNWLRWAISFFVAAMLTAAIAEFAVSLIDDANGTTGWFAAWYLVYVIFSGFAAIPSLVGCHLLLTSASK